MRAWIVRSLRSEGYERLAFDKGFVAVGWSLAGDLTSRSDRSQLREAVRSAYPFTEADTAADYAEQLYLFRTEMANGDLVLLPRRSSPEVAAGWVVGDYQYRTDLPEEIRHTRAVRWLRVDLARADVERELPNLSPLKMVFRIDQTDFVNRLRNLVDSGGPPPTADEIPAWQGISEELEPFANLRRNLGYARRLATAGQHLSRLQVGAFEVSDVYRAAWVQAIAALDHWVGEEVRARMRRLAHPLAGSKPAGFSKFAVPIAQLERFLQSPASLVDILEEEFVRTRGHLSYQSPEKIKDEFKLVSDVKDLWTEVAKVLSGRSGDGTAVNGQHIRSRLSEVASRRHKIVHESDVDPENPSSRRPIDGASTTQTIDWIEQLAAAIIEALDNAE